jgi:hypothetical protein
MQRRRFIFLALLLLTLGFSTNRSVPGGTPGVLRSADGNGLREVQINVHRAQDRQLIGFGVSTEGGAFALYQLQAKGPLYLEPGEYVFTLESIAPELIPLPPATRDPQRTPLRQTWASGDKLLELQIP